MIVASLVATNIQADRKMLSGWFEQVRAGKEAKRKIVEYLDAHPENRLLVLMVADKFGISADTITRWRSRYQQLKPDSCPDQDIENIHFSSESSEWYTPTFLLTRVKTVLGHIDLDPCASQESSVPAIHCFTKHDNGLRFDWCGNVYMNPPYGREIELWVKKLLGEYQAQRTKEAIALVPARVDTDWFRLFRDCMTCFISGRLKFSNCENSAPFPSALIYLGPNLERFAQGFYDVGDIWIRWKSINCSGELSQK